MNDSAAKFDDDDLRHLACRPCADSLFPSGRKEEGRRRAGGGIDGARACGSKVGQLCKWVCSNVARSLPHSPLAWPSKSWLNASGASERNFPKRNAHVAMKYVHAMPASVCTLRRPQKKADQIRKLRSQNGGLTPNEFSSSFSARPGFIQVRTPFDN